jgi:hypothetical protein
MVKLAKSNHPDKNFQHVDFMDYQPPLLPPSLPSASINVEGIAGSLIPSSSDTKNEKFGTILFNECMHYFLDVEASIKYASTLIQSKGMCIKS